jgi:hypothetical protein
MIRFFALAILLSLSEELSRPEFEKLHREIKPPTDEAWRKIPWTASLHKARERAIAEKKPLFLWSEAGNPLGCT